MIPSTMLNPDVRNLFAQTQRNLEYLRPMVPVMLNAATRNWTDEVAVAALKEYLFGKTSRIHTGFTSDVPSAVARNLGPGLSAFHTVVAGFYGQIKKARRELRATAQGVQDHQYVKRWLNKDNFRVPDGVDERGRTNWRYVGASAGLRTMDNRVESWWPTFGKSAYFTPVMHRSQHAYGQTFKYTPGMIRLRRDRGLPFVATERLILDFIGDDGLPFVPERLEEDVPVPVLYFEKKYPLDVKQGWVVEHGGQHGVASKVADARKAAKMKAVRAAKKALGLD